MRTRLEVLEALAALREVNQKTGQRENLEAIAALEWVAMGGQHFAIKQALWMVKQWAANPLPEEQEIGR